MKKMGLVLLCVALLLSMTACTGDVGYSRGMRLLREGDVAGAYEQFCASTDTRSPRVLQKFVWVPLTHTFTDPNGRLESVYTYNEAGYLAKKVETYTRADGSVSVLTDEYEYDGTVKKVHRHTDRSADGTYTSLATFDEKGNTLYFADWNDGVLFTETNFVYDQRGNLLQCKGTGEGYHRYLTYTYDEKGRPLTYHNEHTTGMVYDGRYVYAEDGSYVMYEDIDNGEGVRTLQTDYDAEGRILREAATKEDGTAGDLTEYRYDEKGNQIYMQKHNDYLDTTEITTYQYDEEDRLLEEKSTDKAGKITHVYKYTYTEDGQKLTCDTSDDGVTWVRSEWSYDEAGRLIRSAEKWPDNTWSTMVYTLNEDGTVKTVEATGSAGQVTKAYVYDQWGNCTSSRVQKQAPGVEEASATATWELHYFADGVPEELRNEIMNLKWE